MTDTPTDPTTDTPTDYSRDAASTPSTNSQSWQDQARSAGWQQPEENSGFQQSTPTTAPPQTTPVDIGTGSVPMNTPLTPENRSGYTGDVNKETGLPKEMSLGEVFNNIKLAPHQIAALLGQFASSHHGGPNQELATKLNQEAVSVTNPQTYDDSNR